MKSLNHQKITHVIFDMDGLLLDTEAVYTKVSQIVVEPYGKQFTWKVKSQVMGLQREESAFKVVSLLDLPISWEEYQQKCEELYSVLMPQCELMPGIVRDICKTYNKNYTRDVRMKILGTTEQRTAEIAINELKLPINTNEFRKSFLELCKLRLVDAPLLKGAERLVRHLHFHKIPIALATSSGKESVEVKTQKHKELFSLFNVQVMGSSDPEVKLGKPAPDIFLVAAKRFPDNPKPEQCLVFEDAPNGVRAARDAGMQVVMVPDTHLSQEEKTGADLVIPSLEHIDLELFGLPPLPK